MKNKKSNESLPVRYITSLLAILCILFIAIVFIAQPSRQHWNKAETLAHNSPLPSSNLRTKSSEAEYYPDQPYKREENRNQNPKKSHINKERIISVSELPLGKDPFELKLFDKKVVKVIPHSMKAIKNDNTYYKARIKADGQLNGELSIVRNKKDHKAISGRLILETGELFSITSTENGQIKLQEIDSNKMPGCSAAKAENKFPTTAMDLKTQNTKTSIGKENIAHDSSNELDVLVLYTPNAKNAKGGQSAIEADILLGIENGNEAFARHGSNLSLRAVHIQEISYTESGDPKTDLERLTYTGDNFMDEVHDIRAQYGADVVSLIFNDLDTCGRAHIISNLSSPYAKYWAFNVVTYNCTSSNLSLVHEIGHNLGLRHDHDNADSSAHPFAYGHRFGSYRSVMAYQPGTRITLFSSPNHTYEGEVTGIPEGKPRAADNTRAININAPYAIAFFDRVVESYVKISGTVLDENENPLSGVLIDGGSLGFQYTNSSGYFEFTSVVMNSSFTLKLSKENYTFEPSQVSGTAESNKNFNFTAKEIPKYNIEGKITENGQGLSGITVNGGNLGTRTTNSNGEFSFQSIAKGTSYSISFQSKQYSFSPASVSGTLSENTSYQISATINKYNITGKITENGKGLSGITVNGGNLGTRTTNSKGEFSFQSIAKGTSYSISFQSKQYSFSPASVSGTLSENTSYQISATTNTVTKYNIEGKITENGKGLSGITVNGGNLGTTTTNSKGEFSFQSIAKGTSYSISFQSKQYSFSPASVSGTLSENTSYQISATTNTVTKYNIEGKITENGKGLSGITVNGGENLGTTTTNSKGEFSFQSIAKGTSYSISFQSKQYSFSPASVSGTLSENTSYQISATTNTVTKYNIEGKITENGKGLSGVTVNGGENLGTTTTNSKGEFSFQNIAKGTSYSISFQSKQYSFSPASVSGTLSENTSYQISATINTITKYNIEGKITENGKGLSGVTVNGGENLGTTTTNSKGEFSFQNIAKGTSYSISFQSKQYSFSPASVSGTLSENTSYQISATINTITKYNIEGKITENGKGLSGVIADGGSLGIVVTNSNGEFSFQNIEEGTSYSISFQSNQYTLSPASISGTLSENTSYQISATIKGNTQLPNDTDGDGVSNEQEIKDETNPYDSGSFMPTLPTIMCSDWNGFLGGKHYQGMHNILEYRNQSSTPLTVKAVLYKMDGRAEGRNESPSINSGGQFDLLVHDMKGRSKDEIGLVCYSHAGKQGDIDGNMVYYKMDSQNKGEIEFAFAMPMAAPLSGNIAVPFNTFHPSYNEEDQKKLVANWIQLSNRSETTQSGYMIFIEEGGNVLETTRETLKPSQRIDLSGHKFGKQKVGIALWHPDNLSATFQLHTIRYFYDNIHLSPDFYTAFHIPASKGIGETIVLPLDSSEMGSAIIEISNVTSNNSNIDVEIYDNEKPLTDVTKIPLDLVPFQTTHIITDPYLPSKRGIAIIKPNAPESTIATGIQYDRDKETGKIKSIYIIKAREALGKDISTSWNTWEGQSCKLLISNPTSQTQRVKMSMKYDSGDVIPGVNDVTREIKPKDVHIERVCNYADKDEYGKIELKLEQKNSVVASVVRIGKNDSYKFSTPLR